MSNLELIWNRRKIALPAIFMGILLGSLLFYSLITRNLEVARIIITIYIIIILSTVLLALSSKELTKFQPSLKELYRKLFKDPPISYFLLGVVILIGFNLGIFSIFVLFFCEEWNNVCGIITLIFCIFLVLGAILMFIGLILIVKKGIELRKKGIM